MERKALWNAFWNDSTKPWLLIEKSQPSDDRVRFTSDCDLLEVKEVDTQPGTVSERYRKLLEQKYGRKTPSNGPGSGRDD